MNSTVLSSILLNDFVVKQFFRGVYAVDQIQLALQVFKLPNVKNVFIVNTDTSDRLGVHWLCLYFNENDDCTLFDSLNNQVSSYSHHLLSCLPESYRQVPFRIQSTKSSACSIYCIFFSHELCRGKPLNKIMSVFDARNCLFNDSVVCSSVVHMFL
jgi:hypothetical protein